MRGSWRRNRTATYWPPLLWPSAFLSRSPGLLNRGPTLLGAGFLYCILSATHLISKLLNRGSRGPPLLGVVLSTVSLSNWLNFLCPSYIIVHAHLLLVGVTNRTHSTRPRSRLYSDIPRPDSPVIYTGAFPILTAWPGQRLLYNITSLIQ